jgi:hypothetical protein
MDPKLVTVVEAWPMQSEVISAGFLAKIWSTK